MSLIGKKAPEWTAKAYQKGDEVTISNKDFAGKWHVLYWYPLDFTFICPTEIRGFEELLGEFKDDGVAVIGASTDSFFSHKAWFADRATFADSHQLSVGVRDVWVNGTRVLRDTQHTGATPGRVVRHGG